METQLTIFSANERWRSFTHPRCPLPPSLEEMLPLGVFRKIKIFWPSRCNSYYPAISCAWLKGEGIAEGSSLLPVSHWGFSPLYRMVWAREEFNTGKKKGDCQGRGEWQNSGLKAESLQGVLKGFNSKILTACWTLFKREHKHDPWSHRIGGCEVWSLNSYCTSSAVEGSSLHPLFWGYLPWFPQ